MHQIPMGANFLSDEKITEYEISISDRKYYNIAYDFESRERSNYFNRKRTAINWNRMKWNVLYCLTLVYGIFIVNFYVHRIENGTNRKIVDKKTSDTWRHKIYTNGSVALFFSRKKKISD